MYKVCMLEHADIESDDSFKNTVAETNEEKDDKQEELSQGKKIAFNEVIKSLKMDRD